MKSVREAAIGAVGAAMFVWFLTPLYGAVAGAAIGALFSGSDNKVDAIVAGLVTGALIASAFPSLGALGMAIMFIASVGIGIGCGLIFGASFRWMKNRLRSS